jgi:hypothetical protein
VQRDWINVFSGGLQQRVFLLLVDRLLEGLELRVERVESLGDLTHARLLNREAVLYFLRLYCLLGLA